MTAIFILVKPLTVATIGVVGKFLDGVGALVIMLDMLTLPKIIGYIADTFFVQELIGFFIQPMS